MEEKLVAYMQELLDAYVEWNRLDCQEMANDVCQRYNACHDMVERVTGKKINTSNWVVSLVDELPGIELAK